MPWLPPLPVVLRDNADARAPQLLFLGQLRTGPRCGFPAPGLVSFGQRGALGLGSRFDASRIYLTAVQRVHPTYNVPE